MPLGPLTTLKVGGPARFFVEARTEGDVLAALRFARDRGLEMFILAGGSNVLVSDRGFGGLVVKIGLLGVSCDNGAGGREHLDNPENGAGGREHLDDPENGSGDNTAMFVTVQAGEGWDEFVEYCVNRQLAGVECLSGIPGTVGATPVQNVGAYGQDVSETIDSVRCLDLQTGEVVDIPNEKCGFDYRTSIFNSTCRGRYVVLSVIFRLLEGGPPKVAYKDLRDIFGGGRSLLQDVRAAVIRIRRAKSMVIDPADPNHRSAGSFFKNPILPASTLKFVSEAAAADVPSFPAGDGSVKIPAAWLIEQAGFHRGFYLGNAGISTNHSLALVNNGGATASEIVALKNLVQDRVHAKFGIALVPEPVFVGF